MEGLFISKTIRPFFTVSLAIGNIDHSRILNTDLFADAIVFFVFDNPGDARLGVDNSVIGSPGLAGTFVS